MSTTIYLVRHAHAEWGPDEARPLSAAGTVAARGVARLLSKRPIAAIYTSASRRAIDTVAPLAHALGLEPRIVNDLRERELPPVRADEFEAAVEESWRFADRARPGAESNIAAQTRGVASLRRILNAHGGEHVVLATHGTLLALLLNSFDPAFGFDFWRQLSFPDIYEVEFTGEAMTGVRRIWTNS